MKKRDFSDVSVHIKKCPNAQLREHARRIYTSPASSKAAKEKAVLLCITENKRHRDAGNSEAGMRLFRAYYEYTGSQIY